MNPIIPPIYETLRNCLKRITQKVQTWRYTRTQMVKIHRYFKHNLNP